MPKQILALACCRVSSNEQLLNNSLNRQEEAVIKAAKELDATILENDWWSGSVSSKHGTNLDRKDLQEMLERCKKDKRIKYVIVDEPDRFMRSIDEAAYFEVMFRQLNVIVWYASDSELNTGTLSSKLLKFTKYLSAEGSNEERQHKSIEGGSKALRDGRYPYNPKLGYMRGPEGNGIHAVHPAHGPALQAVLVRMTAHLITPPQGLKELNVSLIENGRRPYKMDKFRKIVADPYYAGVVEINKQIKVRTENGLHEALITMEQHLELLRIMNAKAKNQAGPRKNGNPIYPMNNITHCAACVAAGGLKAGRYVGYDHGNGKNPKLVYQKYRCRTCGRYLTRDALHNEIERTFNRAAVAGDSVHDIVEALETVWKQKEGQAARDATRLANKIKALQNAISEQALAAIDPSNAPIKQEIMASVAKRKSEVADMETEIAKLRRKSMDDRERFMKFAYNFIDNMGHRFLDTNLSHDNRLRCKQIIFPAGFYLDDKNKVYTPEISPLYRLTTLKKDAEASDLALMVRVKGL